ncbi:hypothetical protein EX30DRAFT_228247 [Ascodesmis nigricans]|uniref:Uncharacterized protein n=1 Tax=Ascodesmis nigricans TaxID=341454 RepID=A0A4S2MIR9_9PEZI|nr:hypothetical protein EX30DRAFT_228247 [Ascodesmis nigricans]
MGPSQIVLNSIQSLLIEHLEKLCRTHTPAFAGIKPCSVGYLDLTRSGYLTHSGYLNLLSFRPEDNTSGTHPTLRIHAPSTLSPTSPTTTGPRLTLTPTLTTSTLLLTLTPKTAHPTYYRAITLTLPFSLFPESTVFTVDASNKEKVPTIRIQESPSQGALKTALPLVEKEEEGWVVTLRGVEGWVRVVDDVALVIVVAVVEGLVKGRHVVGVREARVEEMGDVVVEEVEGEVEVVVR